MKLAERTGTGPFPVTAAGLVLTAAAAWFVWGGRYIPGAVLLAAGSVLDAVDGEIARRKGMVTRAGAVIDSAFDRIGELLIFGAMLAGDAGMAHRSLAYLVPASIGGAYMVSYVRARAEAEGISCSVGLFTRTERLLLVMAGLVAAAFWNTSALVIALAVMTGGTWLTAAQRLLRVVRDGRAAPHEER